MTRIAFYMTNRGIKDVDCRNIENGNPGIGGTYFSMISLVNELSKIVDEEFTIKLYIEEKQFLPSSICIEQVKNTEELKDAIISKHIDILVVNKIGKNTLSSSFFNIIHDINIKVIIWAHCFIPVKELSFYSTLNCVSRIVCVSKEQLYTYCDHNAFNKSVYIFNGICKDSMRKPKIPYKKRDKNVIYIGSLVPLKGFHILAKAWKKVIKRIPTAKLYVIGGGNLYDRSSSLGKYNLADFLYETKFMKYLTNKDGSLLSSVYFLGIMGEEKKHILENAKVGVPNPSGKTETFGYTAIEMELAGLMITTKKCPGYCDTVYNKSGVLYNSSKQLAKTIISLLQREDYSSEECEKFIYNTFGYDKIVEEWKCLFREIKKEIPVYHEKKITSSLKWTQLKAYNRHLKNTLKGGKYLPSLLIVEEAIEKMIYYCERLIDFSQSMKKIWYRYLK